jgi:DNA-binding HxlR family transcriptional regulator
MFAGVTRFADFQANLGIAPNILAVRLDGLVAAGIMETRVSAQRRGASEYLLTARGADLAPALIALTEWGDRWAAPEGRPIVYLHRECGAEVAVALECSGCGRVPAEEVTVSPGPGMPADYLAKRRPARSGG